MEDGCIDVATKAVFPDGTLRAHVLPAMAQMPTPLLVLSPLAAVAAAAFESRPTMAAYDETMAA